MARKKPIIENVEIVGFGHKGLTIGKTPAGEAVLVEAAVPGDVVNFQVRRKKKGMKLGHVSQFVKRSEHLTDPKCMHFGVCGGCSWQNLSYDEQCVQKAAIVENAIRRIGHLESCDILPILGAELQYEYRNKVEYTFASRRWLTEEEIHSDRQFDEGGLGFHKAGMFDKVVDITKCHLQAEPSNEIRNATRDWAISNGYSFYNYKTHEGDLRNLIVRSTRTGDLMLTLVTASEDQAIIDSFAELVEDRFPQVSSLICMVNQKMNDSLFDIPFTVIKGEGYITEQLDHVSYRIGPKSFFQTNPYQAEKLFREAKEACELKPSDVLYDLYCGVGSIGLYMSDSCDKVIGIEEIPEAIEDAKVNATINNQNNAFFEVGDVGKLLDRQFLNKYGAPDVVITDPPRAGMHESVVRTLNQAKVPRMVYISCNPATQARDLKMLSEIYEVETVRAVDMFPQTNHVESIAKLKLRS